MFFCISSNSSIIGKGKTPQEAFNDCGADLNDLDSDLTFVEGEEIEVEATIKKVERVVIQEKKR